MASSYGKKDGSRGACDASLAGSMEYRSTRQMSSGRFAAIDRVRALVMARPYGSALEMNLGPAKPAASAAGAADNFTSYCSINAPASQSAKSIGVMLLRSCAGKVWVRCNGWVYRAKEPGWFWWEVALD